MLVALLLVINSNLQTSETTSLKAKINDESLPTGMYLQALQANSFVSYYGSGRLSMHGSLTLYALFVVVPY